MASGSWNGDCKIWKQINDGTFKETVTLAEHSYAVQCLILNSGNVVTSSQDGNLNLFSISGKLIKQFPSAHLDIVRKIKVINFGEMSQMTGHFSQSIINYFY